MYRLQLHVHESDLLIEFVVKILFPNALNTSYLTLFPFLQVQPLLAIGTSILDAIFCRLHYFESILIQTSYFHEQKCAKLNDFQEIPTHERKIMNEFSGGDSAPGVYSTKLK